MCILLVLIVLARGSQRMQNGQVNFARIVQDATQYLLYVFLSLFSAAVAGGGDFVS